MSVCVSVWRPQVDIGVDIELLCPLHFETDVGGLDTQQILFSQPQLHQNLSRKFFFRVCASLALYSCLY